MMEDILGILINSLIELIAILLPLILINIEKRKFININISIDFVNIVIQIIKLLLVLFLFSMLLEKDKRLIFIIISAVFTSINIIIYSVLLNKQFLIQKNDLNSINNHNSKYQSYNGVFAVSAIIMTNDCKFLLVKRKGDDFDGKDMWVQPGTYIRTNEIKKFDQVENIPELQTFYDYLKNEMKNQTGLSFTDYEYLHLGGLIEDEKPTFSGEDINRDINRDNYLSPTPFLIQKEKSLDYKSSGKNVHIDCFFAFKINKELKDDIVSNIMSNAISNDAKYFKSNLFSYDEIVKLAIENKCYKDLIVIIGKFLSLWRKNEYYLGNKFIFRHCTFNIEKNTLWLRINQYCNLNCKFCLLKDKSLKKDEPSDMTNEQRKSIENIIYSKIKEIREKDINKLVITGGEPLLIKNLFDIIENIINIYLNISFITICSNGTHWRVHKTSILTFNDKMRETGKKINFTLNMSSCSADMHQELTGAHGLFAEQKDFIKWLNENNIIYTANVVLTKKVKEQLMQFIIYWKQVKVKNLALSYIIRQGMMFRNINDNICLNKDECVNLYKELFSGKYEIEFLDTVKLLIPSCDDLHCQENKNIISIELQKDNCKFINGCLDQN